MARETKVSGVHLFLSFAEADQPFAQSLFLKFSGTQGQIDSDIKRTRKFSTTERFCMSDTDVLLLRRHHREEQR